MSSFTEDSLTTTRAIHRLLMTATVVTLVFALSLERPEEKIVQQEALSALRRFDFKDYEQFCDSKVKDAYPSLNQGAAAKVSETLKDISAMVLGTQALFDAFEAPAHVGKGITQDLALSNVLGATLEHLEALPNAVKIDAPIQVWMPNVDAALPGLEEKLRGIQPGDRIASVRWTLETEPTTQSFIDGEENIVTLWFEVIPAGGGSRPQILLLIPAKLHNLPQTSWWEWFKAMPEASDVARRDGEELRWLPSIEKFPDGFKQKSIGTLISELSGDLEKAGPAGQKVSLLGLEVPGVLVAYASPLFLLTLSYYLLLHLQHISRFASEEKTSFQRFAWMPVALGNHWKIEAISTVALLPAVSVVLLIVRMRLYTLSAPLSFMICVSAAVAILILGRKSFGLIGAIRRVSR